MQRADQMPAYETRMSDKMQGQILSSRVRAKACSTHVQNHESPEIRSVHETGETIPRSSEDFHFLSSFLQWSVFSPLRVFVCDIPLGGKCRLRVRALVCVKPGGGGCVGKKVRKDFMQFQKCLHESITCFWSARWLNFSVTLVVIQPSALSELNGRRRRAFLIESG